MPKIKARERWQRSPTPAESWSDAEGANSDGEWEIEIIGEEVDEEGHVKYEAEWSGWSREDGTNTTWDNDLLEPRHYKEWIKMQAERRFDLAKESLDIKIWASMDIHNTNTRLRAQAYDEKLKAAQRQAARKNGSDDLPTRMAELMASQMHLFNEPSTYEPPTKKSKLSTSRTQSIPGSSRAKSSTSVGKRSSSTTSSKPSIGETSTASTRSVIASSSSWRTASTPLTAFSVSPSPKHTPASNSNKGKGKRLAESPGHRPLSPSPAPMPPPSRPRLTKPLPSKSGRVVARNPTAREILEERWNRASNAASPITFSNDIDDEQVPPLCENFRYLESVYDDPSGFQLIDDEFLLRCECDVCIEAKYCDCQSNSELVDEKTHRAFAYTGNGLFAFNVLPGDEVVECNRCCRCDMGCQNRVTQQARDFSVQIFKTPDRGWGVRPMEDIPRGKVLGLYTGLLMTRKAADELGHDRRSYCFDLDGQEVQDDNDSEDELMGRTRDEGYTVDSLSCGNWTRFINHSCGPNLQVYLVVHNTVPDRGLHYIAFVAAEPIAAMTEFTFDYDPKAANAIFEGKGKGKVVIPPGCRRCFCGSSQCRQYLKV